MRWLGLLRRSPAFARFWLAEAISLAGDWFSLVAVSVLAVQHGGGEGALAVAVTLALYEVPMALVRPIGGVLADRFDRRDLLVVVHLGQVVLTAAMAWRAAAGDLVALQALVLARSLLAGLDWPARAGALRRLVAEEDLLLANAFSGATWSAMYALGMALGGLVSSFGVAPALACDAASFAVAAALLLTLPRMPTRGAEGALLVALGRSFADLRDAARLALADRELFTAVAAKTPLGLAGGAGVVLLNVLADQTAFAGTGALSLGLLQAARGVGTGVGPLLAERAVERGRALSRVWAVAVLAALVGIALLAVSRGIAVAMLAAALVWGMGTGANWMLSSAELQRRAPDHAIGRLAGLDMLSVELSFGLAALGAGLLVDATRVPATAAVLAVALGGTSWLALRRAAGT